MNNKVELKVNVINQLKLFRQSTFKDILCFLDEDIQNAQRAKATEIRVDTDRCEKKLIIENNGAILDDPQSLFSIAESGWDNETKKNESPFGIGFFSNISVSNLVEVITGNKHIVFDVDKMINTGDCTLEVLKSEEYYEGFKLILNNFDYDTIPTYEIGERVERLGKYIHGLDIYYDGIMQDKKNLTEGGQEYCFSTTINDSDMKGWIAINSNYSFAKEVSIYYKGRFVSEIDYPYLKGDIHINDSVLNLTSPDRKDIIKDKKYSNFKELLDLYIKELVDNSFKNGDDEDIEKYCNAINYYVDKKSLLKNTKFSVFKGSKSVSYLKNIAIAKSKNKNIKTFDDYKCHLDKERANQGESHVEEVFVVEKMKSTVKDAEGTVYEKSSTSYHDGRVIKPEIKEKDTTVKDGEFILSSSEPIFWIGFDEISEFEYKFNTIQHYGLKLIVARNTVEQSILKSINEELEVFHISDLSENVTFKSTISNTVLNIKERRALMILDMVSKMFEFSHNMFSIGDVMTIKTVSLGKTDIENDIIDENVVIIKDSKAEKVYVDRSIINLAKLTEDLDEKISLKDIQFILQNLDDISESISLLKNIDMGKVKDTIIKVIGNMN